MAINLILFFRIVSKVIGKLTNLFIKLKSLKVMIINLVFYKKRQILLSQLIHSTIYVKAAKIGEWYQ